MKSFKEVITSIALIAIVAFVALSFKYILSYDECYLDETIDNQITNELVDQGELPEEYREIYPQ